MSTFEKLVLSMLLFLSFCMLTIIAYKVLVLEGKIEIVNKTVSSWNVYLTNN